MAITKILLGVAPLAAAGLLLAGAGEEEEATWTLRDSLREAQEACDANRYRECLLHLQTATAGVRGLWAQRIAAALPPAPPGFEIWRHGEERAVKEGPAAPGVLAGTVEVKRSWRGLGALRGSRLTISVTADCPVVKLILPALEDPVLSSSDPRAEVIPVGSHRGIHRVSGDAKRSELQIVLGRQHLVRVTAENIPREQKPRDWVLGFIGGDALDEIAAVLRD
jgi:hypothetical protein